MLGVSSSSSSSSSPTEVIEFQEGGGPSLDVIVEVTGFNNGRSTSAGSWSGDRVAAGGTSALSARAGFDNAAGGFGGSAIEGAALGTGLGEAVRSIPCAVLSGPLDGSGGDSWADTIRSGSSDAANPSTARNSCPTSLPPAWNNETFSTGGRDRTNGGSLGCNKTSNVPELSST